jgi:NLP/P60 protein
MFFTTNISKATTVEVTTDNLNFRREASTDSEVIMAFQTGYKCELIAEEGNWYKVKYLGMIGYISKDYAKKEQEPEKTEANAETPTTTNTEEPQKPDEQQTETISNKVLKDTSIKILPLIYSENIGSLKQGTQIEVINTTTTWAYIQTNQISGWIRKDIISTETSTKNNQTNNNAGTTTKNEENNNVKYEEKTAYVNDTAVNMRKSATTDSDIIKVLALNTEITLIGEEGDWYKVKSSEDVGYIAKRLVSEQKKETTSRSAEVRTTTNIPETANDNTETTSSTKGEDVVAYAKQYLNCPYVYGAAGPNSFDCSGFTMYMYKHFGISLPHGATSQSRYGTELNINKSELKSKLKPGDLVFFLDYPTYDGIGHVGIYIGDGNFIHASSGTGYCVKISTLLDGGYYDRYTAARRIF